MRALVCVCGFVARSHSGRVGLCDSDHVSVTGLYVRVIVTVFVWVRVFVGWGWVGG